MSTTLKNRIEHLFPARGGCLKEIACLFAERRGQWLTQGDIINLIGKRYPNSTISNNFKKLSSPMKDLEGHCYLETEILDNRGLPIRARLGEVAAGKLFKLVTPKRETLGTIVKEGQKPASTIIGRIVVPPMVLKNSEGVPINPRSWLPSEDMIALRKRKIGEQEAEHMLQDIAGRECISDEIPFATDYGDLRHHNTPGRIPKLRRLTDKGIMEFASDTNQTTLHASAYIAPNWVGIWETDFGKLEIMLEIVNERPRYTGTYPNGVIEGETEADIFIGTWHEGANSGDFKFTMFSGGHSFWGDRYDETHRRLNDWNGRMIGHEERGLE